MSEIGASEFSFVVFYYIYPLKDVTYSNLYIQKNKESVYERTKHENFTA